MNYLADTVAIVFHLRRQSKLGEESGRILREADLGMHHVYISAISLMEVLYLAEARRISLPLNDLIRKIEKSVNYSVAPVDSTIVGAAQSVDDVPELHDRILVATAVYYQVPILTPDRAITASRFAKAIWD